MDTNVLSGNDTISLGKTVDTHTHTMQPVQREP